MNYIAEKYFEYEIVSENNVEITGYKDNSPQNVVIPPTINGKTVVSIGLYAFENKDLRSVIIPDTVKKIGKGAFSHNNLEVICGDSVKEIDDFAFYSCHLKSFKMPKSLTYIGMCAFQYCDLEEIKFPDSLEVVDMYAFSNNKLKNVILGKNTKTIEEFAFSANYLKSIQLPDLIEGIGRYAFSENELVEVKIPKSIKYLDKTAFYNNFY